MNQNLESIVDRIKSLANMGYFDGFSADTTSCQLPCAFCENRKGNPLDCVNRGCKI